MASSVQELASAAGLAAVLSVASLAIAVRGTCCRRCCCAPVPAAGALPAASYSALALFGAAAAASALAVVHLAVAHHWQAAAVARWLELGIALTLALAGLAQLPLAYSVVAVTNWTGSGGAKLAAAVRTPCARSAEAITLGVAAAAGWAAVITVWALPVRLGWLPLPWLVAGLALPGAVGLSAAIAASAVASADAVLPALSVLCAIAAAGAGAGVYLLRPRLPAAFESAPLALCFFAFASALGAFGAADFIRRPAHPVPWVVVTPRERRHSTQSSVAGGSSAAVAADGATEPLLLRSTAADAADAAAGLNAGQRQQLVITLCWFAMGFVNALPNVALRQFIIQDLQADPATQAIIYGVIGPMPWNFKFVAAFLSDSCPILGRRRIPYYVLALVLQFVGWTTLAKAPPSIGRTAALRLLTLTGSMVHGVMCDTIVVETMKRHEHALAERGKLQSGTWLAGLVGNMAGTPFGGWFLEFYPQLSNANMMLLVGGLNALEVLLALFLSDPKVVTGCESSGTARKGRETQGKAVITAFEEDGGTATEERGKVEVAAASRHGAAAADPDPTLTASGAGGGQGAERDSGGAAAAHKSQSRAVWEAMQLDQVWKPMIFICVFALAPGNGDAFTSFLLQRPEERPDGDWPGGIAPLGFTDSEFAYVSTIASLASVIGTWIFRRYLRNAPWRPLFIVAIIVSSGLSCVQVIE
eukprot:SAG22_NODE_1708_length_3768_cov_2.094576_2_plen_702_part_00